MDVLCELRCRGGTSYALRCLKTSGESSCPSSPPLRQSVDHKPSLKMMKDPRGNQKWGESTGVWWPWNTRCLAVPPLSLLLTWEASRQQEPTARREGGGQKAQ